MIYIAVKCTCDMTASSLKYVYTYASTYLATYVSEKYQLLGNFHTLICP